MRDLRAQGVRARLHDESGEDLGICDLPEPVMIGGLVALEHATYRIVNLVDGLTPDSAIDLLAVVKAVRLRIVSR